jgi:hypothetical protein
VKGPEVIHTGLRSGPTKDRFFAPSAVVALLVLLAQPVLVLTWPAPGLSGYKIPVYAANSGGGRATASTYELTYCIGQSSPSGTSAVSTSVLSSGLVPMLSDIVPPAVVHEPATQVPARTSVEIVAQISDTRSGIDTVRLFFREGGYYTFREKPMLSSIQHIYSVMLPPSSVTERGLVYYIEAVDNKGNVAHYPAGAPDSLVNLPVAFTDLVSPTMPAGEYRMVSIPGLPTDGSPDTIIVDDLGFYGKKAWRLGRWDAQGCGSERCYDEYPSVDDFAPGRAFWLISSEARTFDFSGVSADITKPCTIPLQRGWNQIAAPFGFTTDWLSASISAGGKSYAIGDLHVVGGDTILVEDNLISYDGSYHGFQSQLVPWAGYWIYNSSNLGVDLLVSPSVAALAASAGATDEAQRTAGLAEAAGADTGNDTSPLPDGVAFALRVLVRSPERGEHQSLAGVSPAASDAWDPLDLHEPPAIGDYTRGFFLRQDWGRLSGRYLADVVEANAEGVSWPFQVESSSADHPSLDLKTAGRMPSDWQVFLYDLDAGLGLGLESLPYSFDVEPDRRFLLVAGTRSFIETREASGDLNLRPGITGTAPNPFGPAVKITFFLPSAGPASLRVYSVDGRLVRTLDERVMERGIHAAAWNGESSSGRQAAPGLYFVRLEAHGMSQVRKVMKITP